VTIERNQTHAQDGVLKFAAPFWGKPRWAALFVAIAREIQELEDTFFDIVESRFLDNATGPRLAMLGALVGQTDPGLGEDTFRALIRVRIRINRSKGTRDDVIEVLQLLGIPLANRSLTNSYPAKMQLQLSGALPLPIDLLTNLLNDTTSGGVGVFVLYEPTVGAIGFSFSNNASVADTSDAWADGSAAGVNWAAAYQV
jgi:hypothetical protein